MERRGGARVLGRRLYETLTLGPRARWFEELGALGRERGQRVLLYGRWLTARAMGGRDQGVLEIAVTGDALGYARSLAEGVPRARWEPTILGPAAARVHLPTGTLEVSVLRGGVLSFLAKRDYTLEGLGFDLTEPGDLLDAWGGLDDLARGKLVPGGDLDPATDPETLLRGLSLELQHGLSPSGRLKRAYPRLRHVPTMRSVRPTVFWDVLDPFLAPGCFRNFADGRLGEVLTTFLQARGFEVGRVHDTRKDGAWLAAMDRIEAEMARFQIAESGHRPGAGLSSAARLGALLRLRSRDGQVGRAGLAAQLGRPRQVSRAVGAVLDVADGLYQGGFPYRIPPLPSVKASTLAAGALVTAARVQLEPRSGDVARLPPDPVQALQRLLGIRIPKAA